MAGGESSPVTKLPEAVTFDAESTVLIFVVSEAASYETTNASAPSLKISITEIEARAASSPAVTEAGSLHYFNHPRKYIGIFKTRTCILFKISLFKPTWGIAK